MTTQTDRELLELAAKAIGGTLSEGTRKRRTGDTWDEWEWYGPVGINTPDGPTVYPLTDDGDALRLAVKLGIDLTLHGATYSLCYVIAEINPSYAVSGDSYFTDDAPDGDPYAATRRAIVRAAAAIGSVM